MTSTAWIFATAAALAAAAIQRPANVLLPSRSAAPADSSLCVIRDGQVVDDPAATTAERDSTPYLESAAWFVVEREPVTFRGRRYASYGTPRRYAPERLRREGEYRGIPVFSLDGESPHLILLALVNARCDVQVFENGAHGGAVRGG